MSGSALNYASSHAFRQVLNALPAPCCIHSRGIIRFTNPRLVRLLGARGAEELEGRPLAECLAPEKRAEFERQVDSVLTGDEVSGVEQTLITSAGARVDVEMSSTAMEYLDEPAILSVLHDVTARNHVERALREGTRRFQSLVEGDLVGVIEKDAERILEANDTFLKLLGRTRAQLNRGDLTITRITPPEYAELDRQKADELVATGQCKPFEKEYLRPDGSRVPVLLCSAIVAWEPRWRAVGFVIDLTDRRRLQELRSEKLRLESVGVLAAGMAHSLNNLLTAVIGNASLLLEKPDIVAGPRGRGVLDDIMRSGGRAAELTAQLLAYAGQGRFTIGATNIAEMIASEVARLRSDIAEKVRIRLELAGNLPVVVADASQLRHSVIGLLMNAVEAIGDREGEIVIRGRVERVAEETVYSRSGEPIAAGEYCVVEVRDNGSGMDRETLVRAFDPFFTTKFPGRGLGLAAIAGIVAACGGAVRVESTPGVGSVFEVYLPVAGDT